MNDLVLLLFLLYYSKEDIQRKSISVRALAAGLFVFFLLCWSNGRDSIQYFYESIALGTALILLSFCTKEALGGADALITAMICMLKGAKITVGILFFSLMGAALIGVVILILYKEKRMEMPFVPIISVTAFLFLLQGAII